MFQDLYGAVGRVCTGIPFCLGNDFHSFVLENGNFVVIRLVSKNPIWESQREGEDK